MRAVRECQYVDGVEVLRLERASVRSQHKASETRRTWRKSIFFEESDLPLPLKDDEIRSPVSRSGLT